MHEVDWLLAYKCAIASSSSTAVRLCAGIFMDVGKERSCHRSVGRTVFGINSSSEATKHHTEYHAGVL